MLGATIDRISSYKGLSDNDIQLRLLPLLNCYLQSDRYTKVHRVCIKYMLWRLNEATSLKTQVNVYIQNYIRSMCASKELKSPDAFSMLLREVNNNPHFFSDDTIRLILGVLEFDNTRSLIPADPFPATLYNKILSMPNLRHLHKDIYKEVLLKTGIKHDDIHELLSSDEQPKQ